MDYSSCSIKEISVFKEAGCYSFTVLLSVKLFWITKICFLTSVPQNVLLNTAASNDIGFSQTPSLGQLFKKGRKGNSNEKKGRDLDLSGYTKY